MQPRGAQVLSTRDQQIVLERECGDTIVEIGQRHGISHQRVSVLVARANEFVGQVFLDLMVARKTGEVCAYVIPYSPDYTLALDFLDVADQGAARHAHGGRHRDPPHHQRPRSVPHRRNPEEGGMTTATHRQRLEQIRERTHNARAERARARQLLDAARSDHDTDGEAVALVAFDKADQELQVAERLEARCCPRWPASASASRPAVAFSRTPRRSRPWSVSVSPRSRSAAWTSARSARVRS
jgi:hypothetical protein